MTRKTAVVIAPGRGTYNKQELGYLHRHHGDKADLIAAFDAGRAAEGQEAISALDGAAQYSSKRFGRGDNASALIYACAFADYLSINRDAFEIVAVTGNSMGWYIAVACAGGLDAAAGFKTTNTMGVLMHQAMRGGQILYPFVDDQWVEIPGKRAELLALTRHIAGLYVSIHLGGMIVFAGDAPALAAVEKRLPPVQERFPLRLSNHAGFHSPLQAPVAARARATLSKDMFAQPHLPLVDGRGHIWLPGAADLKALYDYTFGHQVLEPYDFTAAVANSVREFAPDVVIVLGPGSTLGGAVAQALIAAQWRGLACKDDFVQRQSEAPLLLSMGMDDYRRCVVEGLAVELQAEEK